MQNKKRLSAKIAGVVALALLLGTSAFAESRPQQRTSREGNIRSERRQSVQSNVTRGQRFEQRNSVSRDAQRSTVQRYDSRSSAQRNDSRSNAQRYDSNRNADRYRNNNSRSNAWRPDSRTAPYRGQSYSGYGRVTRYERYRDGYRVWVGGGLYPIFVPFSSWRLHPLSIGLSIRFGGYWDPLGYWNVYDYSPYSYGGYGGGYGDVYTRGSVSGVVESVDYRRGTVVINDDISRQFVTVTMPRDRRMDDVRTGDYVEFSGDWSRSGVFNAYRLESVQYDRRY